MLVTEFTVFAVAIVPERVPPRRLFILLAICQWRGNDPFYYIFLSKEAVQYAHTYIVHCTHIIHTAAGILFQNTPPYLCHAIETYHCCRVVNLSLSHYFLITSHIFTLFGIHLLISHFLIFNHRHRNSTLSFAQILLFTFVLDRHVFFVVVFVARNIINAYNVHIYTKSLL